MNTVVRFSENIDAVYEELRRLKETSPDMDVVIDCEVENVTAVVFPQAILYGLNLKPGEEYYRNNSYGEVEFNYEAFSNAFVRHEMMLFPNDVTRFTFSVRPRDVDFDNTIFALVIPNMPITDSGNGEIDGYPDPVIDDTPSETPEDNGDNTEVNSVGNPSSGCNIELFFGHSCFRGVFFCKMYANISQNISESEEYHYEKHNQESTLCMEKLS